MSATREAIESFIKNSLPEVVTRSLAPPGPTVAHEVRRAATLRYLFTESGTQKLIDLTTAAYCQYLTRRGVQHSGSVLREWFLSLKDIE